MLSLRQTLDAGVVGIVKQLRVRYIVPDVYREHMDVTRFVPRFVVHVPVPDPVVQITAMMVTKVGRLRPWPTKNWVSTTCECPRIGPKTPLELRKVS